MRLRLALTIVSMLWHAGTLATTNGQPLIDRRGKARKIAIGGDGGRDFLEVNAVHRGLEISRATHLVVMDLDSEMDLDREEVVGEIAETPSADSDFPAAGVEG